jgi:hypothetical protein
MLARSLAGPGNPATLTVLDSGHAIEFSFEDLIRYHGPGSPGGVAHAFKVMERGLRLLDPTGPPERREITVTTSFGGPGARDAFECVTRAVTEDRYAIDPSLARPVLGSTRARFVFRLGYRSRIATLVLRSGFVTEEFLDLADRETRAPQQQARLTQLKQEMATRVMSASATEIYDATLET